jgi:magnesium and cobalt transporter
MIEQELQSVIDEGKLEGVMDTEDEELLHSVIEFGDTLAREVMIPRMDMVAVEITTPFAEVLKEAVEMGHTRLPVFRDSIDSVVGILHSKDLLKVWRDGRSDVSLRELLRPVIFFPENERISVLLREMKRVRTHMAVIVDEFGGTGGLITLEDLVEEIIGEVEDEFDSEEQLVQQREDGWIVDSRVGLGELAEKVGIDEGALKSSGSETVGGLMSELLGRLPRAGEEVSFDRFLFRVAQTDGRRVVKVQLREVDH